MSLLLDALKKAERAKEEAQRRAGEPAAGAPLQLQKGDAQGSDAKHVVMRSELPDISQPLEILSDDIGHKTTPSMGEAAFRAGAQHQGSAAPAANAATPRPQAGARDGTDSSLQRAAARKVFEAKFKETNPRMPFYIAMSVLGAFAVCTAGYFWYQLRPPQALVNANAKPVAAETTVAVIGPAPAGATAGGQIAGLPGSPSSIPGLPSTATSSPAAAVPPAAPAPAQPATAASPAPRAEAPPRAALRPSSAAERAAAPAPTRVGPQVNPKVESAYAAYLSGDVAKARADYEQALRDDPANRDALLGLAAVDTRSGRFEAAETAYVRLLQIDPRDPHAQAGLIALRSGRIDPLVAESRVKTLLAADPGAHVLYFTLGNQLAQQGRWAEAQQQYFKAFAAEPDNPDFAYNLAVSLDHMRQDKAALEYYQRALSLAAKRGASFDAPATRGRVAQLGG